MKAIITFLTILSTVVLAGEEPSENSQMKWQCYLFKGAKSKLITKGVVTPKHFENWFKSDYPVGGERIETPNTAITVGTLILTSDAETLVMPICKWKAGEKHLWACQSAKIGQAPMFRVLEESENALIQTIKIELEKMKEAEKAVEATANAVPHF